MAHVSDSFSAQQGTWAREQFRAFLLLQINRHERIRAQMFPIDVRLLNAEEGIAEFNALLTGGRGLLPEEGRLYHFETVWRQVDGEWQLLEVDWRPVGG